MVASNTGDSPETTTVTVDLEPGQRLVKISNGGSPYVTWYLGGHYINMHELLSPTEAQVFVYMTARLEMYSAFVATNSRRKTARTTASAQIAAIWLFGIPSSDRIWEVAREAPGGSLQTMANLSNNGGESG